MVMDDEDVKKLLDRFYKNQRKAVRKGMRLGISDIKEKVENHDKTLYGKDGKGGLVTQVGKNKSSINWVKWAIAGVVAIGLGVAGILSNV